jgi:hypothetical protein
MSVLRSANFFSVSYQFKPFINFDENLSLFSIWSFIIQSGVALQVTWMGCFQKILVCLKITSDQPESLVKKACKGKEFHDTLHTIWYVSLFSLIYHFLTENRLQAEHSYFHSSPSLKTGVRSFFSLACSAGSEQTAERNERKKSPQSTGRFFRPICHRKKPFF